MKINVYAYTTKYHKKNINEDAMFINDLVISDGYYSQRYDTNSFISCICDGVTGAEKGFYASQFILQSIANAEIINIDDFKHLLIDINEDLKEVGKKIKAPDMSSTLAGIYIDNNRANIFNVGDSRVYKMTDGLLTRMTKDDAVAYKLYLDGVISEREIETHPQKNVLTNYFGNNTNDFEVHFSSDIDFDHNVSYLIVSDGITDFISDNQIGNVLKVDAQGFDLVRLLVGEAMKNGSNDDITAILVEVKING